MAHGQLIAAGMGLASGVGAAVLKTRKARTDGGQEEFTIELEFSHRSAGTTHTWVFRGDTRDREMWPIDLIQGGESVFIGVEDIPAAVRAEIDSMGYDIVER